VKASQCAGVVDSRDASGGRRLSLAQAWSVFLVLVVGAGLAVIVAVLEVLYYRKLFTR